MKLVVAVVDKEREPEALALLERSRVTGYSVIPSVFGKGLTGTHRGNRAFPGENVMIVALVSVAEYDGLARNFAEFAATLRGEEGLKVISLDAEAVV